MSIQYGLRKFLGLAPPACRQCIHHRSIEIGKTDLDRCVKFEKAKVDLVTGDRTYPSRRALKPDEIGADCAEERKSGSCGPDGKNYKNYYNIWW